MKHATQLEMFPTVRRLERSDPAQKMHRFYLMTIQHDLFGGATLVREWGRIGSSGQIAFEQYSDEAKAVDALARIARRKIGRGYV